MGVGVGGKGVWEGTGEGEIEGIGAVGETDIGEFSTWQATNMPNRMAGKIIRLIVLVRNCISN
jgi:hypothetical protein